MLPQNQSVFIFRKQTFKLLGGAFRVFDTNEHLLLFSEQKAFKLREDIRVYSDEGKTREVLKISTQKILDISATYDVVDSETNEKVGSLRRKGAKSIIRDEWEILDSQGMVIGKVLEDSTAMALVRRLLTNLVPQSYMFLLRDRQVGTFKQNFNPFTYRATMDLSPDPKGELDRRLACAAGILLLAIEGRQG